MTSFILLVDFSILKPDIGLIFWTTVLFLIVWFFLGKMAFRPIQEGLKKREHDIQGALDEAKKAREEIAGLKADNEKILAEAREERSKILKEASEMKESIIAEAKSKAGEEANKIVANAKLEIDNQRKAAIEDLKNQVGTYAVEIAEQILKKKLQGDAEQESFIKQLVDDVKLN